MSLTNFSINAERDCGTKYMTRLVSTAFGLPFSWDPGDKHFFGFYDEQVIAATNMLLVGITRNPYDWIMALFKHKHHLPFSYGNDIYLYLTAEWYSIDYRGTGWYTHATPPDQPLEIFTDRDWDTGNRYKNIFALRRKKLLYLQKLYRIAPNYMLFRFEDIMADHNSVVNKIAQKFNLPIVTTEYPVPHKKTAYDLAANVKEIIDANIDWDVESVFGYAKDRREY